MKKIRCAIYTRKSAEEGLEQEFNSLDAQREACAAYVASQKAEGWVLLPTVYEDAGLSGGTLERPGLQRLLADIDAGLVEQIVVYKVDRLLPKSDIVKSHLGALGPVAKLLIYGLFRKGRVLAQDGVASRSLGGPTRYEAYTATISSWPPRPTPFLRLPSPKGNDREP